MFMFSIIHQTIIKVLIYYKLLFNRQNLLVAVSGGQDSLCLIKILHDLTKQYELLWKIYIVNFNHKWRLDSSANSNLVYLFALILTLKVYIYKLPSSINNEELARKWRYKIIYLISEIILCTLVCTAHTRTDKTETFFFNLLRGNSIDSLSSLSLLKKTYYYHYLFRPLVFLERHEITWFCRKFLLPIWSDQTNYFYKFKRNRIREELFPYLRVYLNNQSEQQLNYTIFGIYKDTEYLQYMVSYFYFRIQHSSFIALNYYLFVNLHYALQYRLIKLFILEQFGFILSRIQIIELVNSIQLQKPYYVIDFNNSHYRLNLYVKNSWIYSCYYLYDNKVYLPSNS
uniref:tRNA(Ile)-lysidine synthase, chloroplastic n=1 Tax=Corynoplastis japonica TaxID=700918 RepID=A0A1Y9TME6_9RHOD|nr:tRNA(Ile)-lysidine synthase [Corynoplastis japonica]